MTIYEKDLIFSGRVIPLHVREYAYARRFTLRIDVRTQKVFLTIPPAINLCTVERFIDKHRTWIESQLSRENYSIKEGVKIPLLGIAHTITRKEGRGVFEIIEGDTTQEPKIVIYSRAEHLPRRVADVLKKQAEIIITPLVTHYAQKVEREVKSVRYKDTKSRWGSCSVDGRLSFSWRLIMAPKEIIEYVVAHEIAHLIEMNHGIRFWTLCEKLYPGSKTYRAWLKKNGHTLQAINFHDR
ncbi:M48 family metallopeptidase [Bartonella sp. F02]|uniref:M48 family metallopeptidase n=1 Tax=Bartonella sp. F02 TaxID=2967262 RepID=UPI0022A8E59E|nr:SprT family zinc-dependent metalloprotease [Bartonella sp. F02]MCZ2327974.1 M48 family metallopeptidase [Bartonella sp. F02]